MATISRAKKAASPLNARQSGLEVDASNRDRAFVLAAARQPNRLAGPSAETPANRTALGRNIQAEHSVRRAKQSHRSAPPYGARRRNCRHPCCFE